MNWFRRNNDNYPLSTAEDAENRNRGIGYLLYAVLMSIVIITSAHAILLVVNTTEGFTAGDGLFYWILNVIRVAFPAIVEVAAVAVGLGFLKSQWRGGQRGLGTALEIAWFLFAAANMITFFAFERGEPLEGWQLFWIRFGLPLSALIVAALTYSLMKADPAHKRANERALADAKETAIKENVANAVRTSAAMQTVLERREWRNAVRDLAAEGFDEDEIAFMTDHIPALSDMPAPQAAAPESEPQTAQGVIDWLKSYVGKNTQDAPRQPAAIAEPAASANGREPGKGATDNRPQ